MATQIKNHTHAHMTCDLKTSFKPIPVWKPICWSNASVNSWSITLWWINCDILVLSLVEPMSSSSSFVQGDVPVECLSNVCQQQLFIPTGHMGQPICSPLASSVWFEPVHTWFTCIPQVLN